VARTVNLQRREEIVRRAADHLLDQGSFDVSLRNIATAVGVSPRMLVHHFGSRQSLISQALREARSRQHAAFEARLHTQTGRPYNEILIEAWRWFASVDGRPYMRLFGQLHAVAGAPNSPHAQFLRESVLDWLPSIKAGFEADGLDPTTARQLSVAVSTDRARPAPLSRPTFTEQVRQAFRNLGVALAAHGSTSATSSGSGRMW
jgi:AcrR family transcriptional regulator